MINKLRLENEKLIKKYENDEINLKKQLIIKEILKDNNCFIKMEVDIAISILKDLNIKDENLKEVYLEVVSLKNINND